MAARPARAWLRLRRASPRSPTKGKPVAAPSHLASTKSAALDFGLRYFVGHKGTGQEGRGLK